MSNSITVTYVVEGMERSDTWKDGPYRARITDGVLHVYNDKDEGATYRDMVWIRYFTGEHKETPDALPPHAIRTPQAQEHALETPQGAEEARLPDEMRDAVRTRVD